MKRKTLGERAYAFANKKGHDNSPYWKTAYGAWLAGHRANRLTRAERAVVEAAKRLIDSENPDLFAANLSQLQSEVAALNRKGRK